MQYGHKRSEFMKACQYVLMFSMPSC